MKKKLFRKASDPSSLVKSNANICSEMKDVVVSLDRLSCKSIHVSSHHQTLMEDRNDCVKQTSKSLIEEGYHERFNQGKGEREGRKVELVREWVNMKSGWGRKRGKESFKGGKSMKKTYSWMHGSDDDMSPNFEPSKKRSYTKVYNKVNNASEYVQPDQKLRGKTHSPITCPFGISNIRSWLLLCLVFSSCTLIWKEKNSGPPLLHKTKTK